MYTLYRIILLFVHFLYSLYITIHYFCIMVYRKCAKVRYMTTNTTAEIEALTRTFTKTKKIPRHLVIVYGPTQRSVLDCVRIIGWCITLDIPYISFFDRDGFFQRNEDFLKEVFVAYRPELAEHVIWNSCTKASSQNEKNDCGSKINVSLLSDIDGKMKIVTLTQTLAKAVSSGDLDVEKITDQLIDEKLQFKGMPNPDLAIIYGQTCSTHGLLPWHTRTTEFLMLPLYFSISVEDFVYILEKYSKCVQRYGK